MAPLTKRSAATTAPVDLIPLPAAAKLAGWTPQGFHKLRAAGKLDAVRLGRQWFTTRAEVERVAAMPKDKGGRRWKQNNSESNEITVDTKT